MVPHEGRIVGEFLYELVDEKVTVDSPKKFTGTQQASFMRDAVGLSQLISSGINIAILHKNDELELLLQLNHIANQHMNKFISVSVQ